MEKALEIREEKFIKHWGKWRKRKFLYYLYITSLFVILLSINKILIHFILDIRNRDIIDMRNSILGYSIFYGLLTALFSYTRKEDLYQHYIRCMKEEEIVRDNYIINFWKKDENRKKWFTRISVYSLVINIILMVLCIKLFNSQYSDIFKTAFYFLAILSIGFSIPTNINKIKGYVHERIITKYMMIFRIATIAAYYIFFIMIYFIYIVFVFYKK